MTPASSLQTPVASPPPRPRLRRWLAGAALLLAPWLLILLAWYAIRASGLINPALVPAPHAVFAAVEAWNASSAVMPAFIV